MMQVLAVMASLLLTVSSLALAQVPLPHVDQWKEQYDGDFRKYSKRYFGPSIDWRWFKSQAIAESGLDPNARSAVGALGLMQIMPSTFEEIKKQNPHFVESSDPRWNIAAGIYYNRGLYRKWRTPPAGPERLFFVFGSYNAGYGRIRNALRRAPDDSETWFEIKHLVPSQTRHYVYRIQGLMGEVDQSTPEQDHDLFP